jgi:hypothetical protein
MEMHRPSTTWYDVVAFLSLAAALGLISGVAFGAVALLLSGPAYGADAGTIRSRERLIEGDICERGLAKHIYDQWVVVEIEYQQTHYDGNKFSPRFPMLIEPRPVPPAALHIMAAQPISAPALRFP